MKISVVIPNWNGVDYLKICLPSLIKQSFKDFEIIVIDNGSNDDSINYLEKKYSQIKIIKLKENLGFSKATNAGIKTSKGEYIFLLNNDTKLDKNCLKYLIDATKKNPQISFFATKILNFDKKNLIDNAGDFIDSVGHLYSRGFQKKDGSKYNQEKLIFAGSGGAVLIKKDLFKKIGYFDEDYFFYMEDIDFFFRAQLAGFTGLFVPSAIIYHKHGGTSSKNAKFYEPLIFKNTTETVIKNFPNSLLMHDLNWLKIILVHLNTVRYLVSKGLSLETFKVEWYLLSNWSKILSKRKKIQQSKKVNDQYIIDQVLSKKFKVGGLLF
jgi:GT2 family glycosyltransferase